MRHAIAAVLLCTAPAMVGCTPRLIPGTEIRDTTDTRQILDLVAAYKAGLEGRNVDAVMRTVSKSFFESSGTPEGEDDYDYAGLEQKLRKWAEATKVVRAGIEVKQILVEDSKARVQYFFDVNYQIFGPESTLQWKRETDTKEMSLKREGGAWRIVSGI
ncbi:MAG: hypothetical protein HY901_01475 [Deltaproteobacteria bacterium]|nr:hypothetical protein [Deltaproteobacteria bacterium]